MTGPHRYTLLVAVLAGCGGTALEGPPLADFKTTQKALGDIPIAPKGRVVEFPVLNRGLADLRIEKLVRSCTCVESKVSRSVLPAGASGIIALAIAPQRAEEKSASVSVHTNDPTQPVVNLTVSWRAHAPVEVEPLEIDLGRVRPGQTVERTATIVRHMPPNEACRVEKVSAGPADAVQVSRDSDRLTLLLVAGSSPGPQRGELTIDLKGCWRESVSVPLRWHVADVIEAQPRELMAGSGAPGQRVKGRVVVSAEPGRRLEVQKVRWEEPQSGVETNWKRLNEERAIVDVVWTLPHAAGVHRGNLVVECASPEARTFHIPVTAYVSGEAVAAVRGAP